MVAEADCHERFGDERNCLVVFQLGDIIGYYDFPWLNSAAQSDKGAVVEDFVAPHP